jgi:uncharacterized membrane protein YcaP (DUF421 family)
MNPVLRATAIYLFLLLIFRILGKRSLSEVTSFDFVLLLIIGEATQQALLGEDFSITNAFIVIASLVGIDLILTKLKGRFKFLDELIEGTALIIVENGKVLKVRMKRAGVEVEDVLEAARLLHGLERIDQIKYAVLERNGEISIIPLNKGD